MNAARGVVYLSGPMANNDEHREDFHIARLLVQKAGYIPVGSEFLPVGLKENDYMRIALAILEAADTVVALKGWTGNTGAQIEWAYAKRAGKRCMTLAKFCEENRILTAEEDLEGAV